MSVQGVCIVDKGHLTKHAMDGTYQAEFGFTPETMELVYAIPNVMMQGSGQAFTAMIFKRTPPANAEGFASRAAFKKLSWGRGTRSGAQYGISKAQLEQQEAAKLAKKEKAAAKRQARKRDEPTQQAKRPIQKKKKRRK